MAAAFRLNHSLWEKAPRSHQATRRPPGEMHLRLPPAILGWAAADFSVFLNLDTCPTSEKPFLCTSHSWDLASQGLSMPSISMPLCNPPALISGWLPHLLTASWYTLKCVSSMKLLSILQFEHLSKCLIHVDWIPQNRFVVTAIY